MYKVVTVFTNKCYILLMYSKFNQNPFDDFSGKREPRWVEVWRPASPWIYCAASSWFKL